MMKYLFSKTVFVLLLLAGVACGVAYGKLAPTIDNEGGLHAPFFLIPLGWLSFFLCCIVGCGYLVRVIRNRKNEKAES
jgi:4-hydroxybenzoate polyprenyltransferase